MAGGRAVETSPIFVFRMTFYVHRGSGQARVYPRRVAEPKHSHLKGGINASSAIPPSIRLFEELLSLLVNSRSGINRFCKNYRIWCHILHKIVYCIYCCRAVCVVCVFFPFILDIKFVGRTSRGYTGGRSHRISHPPPFCGAFLNFSREKESVIPFPRRP